MIASIFKTVFALAKAVPRIQEMIDQFIDIYTQRKLDEIEDKYIELNDKKYALMQSIRDAKNDDQRKALSIILADLYGMPESKPHS